MFDPVTGFLIYPALEDRLKKARDGAACHRDNTQRTAVQDAAKSVVDGTVFESIATRIQKFADAGISAASGKAGEDEPIDAEALSGAAKNNILLNAATSILTQGTRSASRAYSTLFE